MHDLQQHFESCFQIPQDVSGSRLTFYFSLDSAGRIIGGQPRTVWFGLRGGLGERGRLIASANEALVRCFPLALNSEMARTIPGKVYLLQFEIDQGGLETVLFRPFGSHVAPEYFDEYGRGMYK
jgi:hypothetical protein